MKMTLDLAQRIEERARKRSSLSEQIRTEILMDWLEGMKYADIQAKYRVSKTAVSNVVNKARKEAQLHLESHKGDKR